MSSETEAQGEDRRQSYRLNKVLGAEIEHQESKIQARLFIIDISVSGFRATNQFELPVQVDLKVKIILQASMPPLESAARIVWVKELPMSGLFQFGFEFLDISDEERLRLDTFIEAERTLSNRPTATVDLGRPWTTIR